MFKTVFYFALLTICSARSIQNQQESVNYQSQLPSFGPQQNDENEVVDNLGGGYSFFGHQVISPRPLAQQTFPTIETHAAVGRILGDTSNRWSDYKRSSAFVNQRNVGFVAPKAHSAGYDQPQFEQPKAFATGYEQQPQFEQPKVFATSYEQQPQPDFRGIVNDDSYGQQRPLIIPAPRVIDTSYRQQSPTDFGGATSDHSYGQQQILINAAPRVIATGCQQQSPPAYAAISNDDTYGQARTPIPPAPTVINSGYGQQRTLIAPAPRVIDTGYGEQAKPDFGDVVSDDSYGQQRPAIAHAPRIIESGYGQQRTLITPAPRIIESGYGQQRTLVAPAPRLASTGCRHRSNPTVGVTSDDNYGQQRPAVALAPKMIASGYGQQQQVQDFSSFKAAVSSDGTQPNIVPGSVSSYSSFEIPAQRSLFVPRAKLSVQSNGY